MLRVGAATGVPLPAAGPADTLELPVEPSAGMGDGLGTTCEPDNAGAVCDAVAGSDRKSASSTYRRENGEAQPALNTTETTGSFTGTVVWIRTDASASGALCCVEVRTDEGPQLVVAEEHIGLQAQRGQIFTRSRDGLHPYIKRPANENSAAVSPQSGRRTAQCR